MRQGQKSVGLKDKVETTNRQTNGLTDGRTDRQTDSTEPLIRHGYAVVGQTSCRRLERNDTAAIMSASSARRLPLNSTPAVAVLFAGQSMCEPVISLHRNRSRYWLLQPGMQTSTVLALSFSKQSHLRRRRTESALLVRFSPLFDDYCAASATAAAASRTTASLLCFVLLTTQ